MTDTGSAVAALTVAWLRALPLDEDTVVSGAGLWPLLGLLAGAAEGPTRSELARAVGLEADEAAAAAVKLLDALDASPDIAAASGTWVRPGIELHEWWRAHVPADSIGELTSQAALDAWARERTDGLIERMPIRLTPEALLVIASALLLRTTWQARFTETERDGRTWLHRSVNGVYDVRTVAAGDTAVTVATVRGEQDVDVQLALGPDGTPAADVIEGLLTGRTRARGTDLLDDPTGAPGVAVREIRGHTPTTVLGLPAFDVRRTHDLLRNADVFGLGGASSIGGFPRLSPTPLQVSQAAQEVVARFFATGFEAAAVTAIAMRTSAMARPSSTARQLEVTFDRPFGFAGIHRTTGVPVVAGWLADVA